MYQILKAKSICYISPFSVIDGLPVNVNPAQTCKRKKPCWELFWAHRSISSSWDWAAAQLSSSGVNKNQDVRLATAIRCNFLIPWSYLVSMNMSTLSTRFFWLNTPCVTLLPRISNPVRIRRKVVCNSILQMLTNTSLRIPYSWTRRLADSLARHWQHDPFICQYGNWITLSSLIY